MLKEDWTPAWTLHAVLLVIKTMLSSIFPANYEKDVNNMEAGRLYRSDRKAFEKKARYWTEVTAIPVTVSRVCRILQIPENENGGAVLNALRSCDWNIIPAVLMFIEANETTNNKESQETLITDENAPGRVQDASLSAPQGSLLVDDSFVLVSENSTSSPGRDGNPNNTGGFANSDASFVLVPEVIVPSPDLSRLSMDG